MYRRSERINEQDVPESQHTIFIRGLSGSVPTSKIREFFEDEFGSCTFDFIKISKDREKLHVAVRFESKTAARECMDKYKDGELFGYRVQLTWFRDIRRYLNHVQKSQGRGRRRYDDDRRRNGDRSWNKRRSRDRSHSVTRSSRSPHRSRSVSRYSSAHSEGDVEQNIQQQQYQETEEHISISPEYKKSQKREKKKDRKKRKRQSNSHSKSHSRSPNRGRMLNYDDDEKGEAPMETSDDDLINDTVLTKVSDQNNTFSTAAVVQNTSFTLDLNSNNPPRQNVKNVVNSNDKNSLKGIFLPFENIKGNSSESPEPPVKATESRNDTKRDLNKSETRNGSSQKLENKGPKTDGLPPPPPPKQQSTSSASSPSSVTNSALNNFKAIQRMILQDVRYKPEENDSASVGNFRLSSLSTQKTAEQIREEKLTRLSTDLQEKVNRKKLQLELSYRHDCETFGLMARKLISKDRALEERFRLALLEIMKDLEAEAMKNFDDYLDQMIFLTA